MDLRPITKRLFDEEWQKFGKPAVPQIRQIQKAVEDIASSAEGLPVMKLEWMPDIRVFRAGKWRQAEVVARIKAPDWEAEDLKSGLLLNKWTDVDIAIPRWSIRFLVPTQSGKKDWEKHRKQALMEEVNGKVVAVITDVLGDYPLHGWYKMFPDEDLGIIAHHEPEYACCKRKVADMGICYGRYKAPDWSTVAELRDAWGQMMTNPFMSRRMPGDAPAPGEIETGARRITESIEKLEDKMFEQEREQIQHELLEMMK